MENRLLKIIFTLPLIMAILCLPSLVPAAPADLMSKTVKPKASKTWIAYLTGPDGNEVKIRHSEEKSNIRSEDIQINGVKKPLLNGSCFSSSFDQLQNSLTMAEFELELKLLIGKLTHQRKPRQLSSIQDSLLASVPACEEFQFDLAIISRLMQNYDLDRVEQF